jgi:hypothetical protein
MVDLVQQIFLLLLQYPKVFIKSNNLVISSIATYPLIVVRTVLHDHRHDYEGHLLDGKKLTFRYVVNHIMK